MTTTKSGRRTQAGAMNPWQPPYETAVWKEICEPRPAWLAGTWNYARGRAASEHPEYQTAVEAAVSGKWNPWWIQTWADVDAVVNHGCYFSEREALRVVKFFKRWIRASKGRSANKPIPLIDWQVYDFLAPLYGWRRANGLRRFRRGGLWIPKKNGKSTLSSGLALFHLLKDKEFGPEIYSAAGDRNQASIIYDEATRMAKACGPMDEKLRYINSKKTILAPGNAGKFAALSAEATLHEGINASLILFDELHVQKNRVLWDTLAGSQIAREEPLFLSLSTAGIYNPLGIGWEEWQRGERIRNGLDLDFSFFSLCYCVDDKADPADPENWRRANPSINATVYEENIRELYVAAAAASAKLDQFRRYHLNIWVRGFNRWLDILLWAQLGEPYTEELLLGQRCFGGLDLGSVDDLTALVLLFPQAEMKCRILSWFWLPIENIDLLEEKHGVPYRRWAEQGHIRLTEGNRTSYNEMQEDVLELRKKFKIAEVRYDPYNAQQLVENLANAGLVMTEQKQGYRDFSPIIKAADVAINRRRLVHNSNPVMDWMAGNCQIHEDPQGNWKLIKSHRGVRFKIDGPVAMVMAHAAAQDEETKRGRRSGVGVR